MKCYICQCEVHIPVTIKCFPCHKINKVHCNTYTRFCYECMVRFLQLNQSVGSRVSSIKCLTCSETVNPNHLNFNNSFEYDFLLHQMKIGLKHKCPYCFLEFDNIFSHVEMCGSAFFQCDCGYVTIRDLSHFHIMGCSQYTKCSVCDLAIKKTEYNTHLETIHELTVCDKCNEITKIENLSAHQKFLCRFRLVRCRFCKENIEFLSLNQHLQEHKKQLEGVIENLKNLLRNMYVKYHDISREQNNYFERYFLTG